MFSFLRLPAFSSSTRRSTSLFSSPLFYSSTLKKTKHAKKTEEQRDKQSEQKLTASSIQSVAEELRGTANSLDALAYRLECETMVERRNQITHSQKKGDVAQESEDATDVPLGRAATDFEQALWETEAAISLGVHETDTPTHHCDVVDQVAHVMADHVKHHPRPKIVEEDDDEMEMYRPDPTYRRT